MPLARKQVRFRPGKNPGVVKTPCFRGRASTARHDVRPWRIRIAPKDHDSEPAEGFLLPIQSHRDLREFRRILRSGPVKIVSHEPDSFLTLRGAE
jgi:hypothetical protein